MDASKKKDVFEVKQNLNLKFLPEFTVAGVLGQGAAENAGAWVPALWDRMWTKAERMEKPDCWGLMGHPEKFLGIWDAKGLYLAGVKVEKDAQIPNDWIKWTVPAQTYLMVGCTLDSYGKVFSSVKAEYLPKHGLTMIGAAQEHYPDTANPENLEICFPVAVGQMFCQSCGMPLTDSTELGTDADGETNYDYCTYCYQKGAFTSDCTMEQMIDFCADVEKKQGIVPDEEEARRQMQSYFPFLKRWRKEQDKI